MNDIRPRQSSDDEPIATGSDLPPDISAPKPTFISWLGVGVGVALVAAYILMVALFPEMDHIWALLVSFAIGIVLVILWIVFSQGFFTLVRAVRLQKRLLRSSPEEADHLVRQALETNNRRFRQSDYRRTYVLLVIADFRRLQGRYAESRDLYRESLEVLRTTIEKRPYFYFIALNNLAVLQIHHKKEADAEAALRQGAKLAGPFVTTQPLFEILMYFNLSRAQARQYKLEAAEQALENLEETLTRASAGTKRKWSHLLTAGRAWLASEREDWYEALRRSSELPTKHQDFGVVPMARAYIGLGRHQDAVDALRPHLEHLQQPGKALLDSIDSHRCLGECLIALGQPQASLDQLAQIRKKYEQVGLMSDPEWARILEKWIGLLESHQHSDFAGPLRDELAQWKSARQTSETGIRRS